MLKNPGKLSLTKGIAIFASASFPKLPNQESKDQSGWNILDMWALLSFISVEILLAKGFLILAISYLIVFLDVRNNSCSNSLSLKFFSSNYNIVPVLLFATYFKLFNCVTEFSLF